MSNFLFPKKPQIFVVFNLTNRFRSVIMNTMKYLINLYSVAIGKAFASAHNRGSSYAPALLEHYRSTRRRLPVMSDGNHWGNHWLSSKKPVRATQGF